MTWTMVTALALGTYALRLTGLLLLRTVELPPVVTDLLAWAPAALIAGLVVVGTVESAGGIVADARLAGMTAALVAALMRAPFPVIFFVGVGGTALVRFVG